ncbi:MAG TPA: cupin domain-containing protein [Xanthobacteraceae bacterium]|jgi:quercetin dioxygenase-like cupin family protein|nr:cupin domain-containing protein [Xanthobacteraceae bacterium]
MCKHFQSGRNVALVAVAAASICVAAASASAGECPADKLKTDVRQPVTTPAQGVTDTVLATINLAKEPVKLKDHLQRIRKLVVQPGGVVPWHSHTDRPALIYIIEGEIVEYASNCSVPIVHKAGDVRAETQGTSHWWKNLSDKPVTLLSFDILHDKGDHNM